MRHTAQSYPKRRIPLLTQSLRLVAKSRWGCETQKLMRYYLAFIRSFIDYARPMLTVGIKSGMGRAELYQNSCLRVISRSSAHARVANLSALFGAPPIRRRCTYLEASLSGNCIRKPISRREKLAVDSDPRRPRGNNKPTWRYNVIDLPYEGNDEENRRPLQFFNPYLHLLMLRCMAR